MVCAAIDGFDGVRLIETSEYPIPVTVEVRGGPALEDRFRVPEREPEAVGEKVTLIEQLALGPRLLVQLLV